MSDTVEQVREALLAGDDISGGDDFRFRDALTALDSLQAERDSLIKDNKWAGERLIKLEAELAEARAENARLVDRHNRDSHNTHSHEAMAYDLLQTRLNTLEEAVRDKYDEIRRVAADTNDRDAEKRLIDILNDMDATLFTPPTGEPCLACKGSGLNLVNGALGGSFSCSACHGTGLLTPPTGDAE